MTDPAWRAAYAIAVPLATLLAGTLAAQAPVEGADARFVLVALPMALVLAIGRALRPGATRRARVVLLFLSLPLPAAALLVHQPIAVTWLTGGVLAMGADAVWHAARRAWDLGSPLPARGALALLAGLPPLYLWTAAAVVLANTQLAMAPVRFAHQSPTRAPEEVLLQVPTRDGVMLEGTLSPSGDGPLVVLTHGVSDGRERMRPWAERLRAEGMPSVRWDAWAHGRSGGSVCTYGQREADDLVRVVHAAREQLGDARPVVAVGTSMGGGTTIAASRRLRAEGVRALVLTAPASSYPRLVVARTALLGPLRDPVLNGSARLARAMGQIPMTHWDPSAQLDEDMPVLVLHGDADRTIPLALSERLAHEHDNVTLVPLTGVGHDEIPGFVAGDDGAWSEVTAYLRRAAR